MKLAWLTDIHLNFLDKDERMLFYQSLLKKAPDIYLISGDIAEAPSVCPLLQEMQAVIKKPIYFVLGNHDYYLGEVASVRTEVMQLFKRESLLYWLSVSGPHKLEKDTALIGQDGWADGRFGNFINSRVGLNDSRLIADLFQQKCLGKDHLLKKMQELGDNDASQLRQNLEQATKMDVKNIIVLTHIPPFKENCLYEGKISNDDYLPYFSSKATGDVLLKVAGMNSSIKFLVLCGHTHSKSEYHPLENLIVKSGYAEYYHPELQEIIEI